MKRVAISLMVFAVLAIVMVTFISLNKKADNEVWMMPPVEEEVMYVDSSSGVSMMSVVVNVDKTPMSYFSNVVPLMNYTGGSSISTPKFVAPKTVAVVNPCNASLVVKNMDVGLSLWYNRGGEYSVVFMNGSDTLTSYRKVAMGNVEKTSPAKVQLVGGYGQVLCVEMTNEMSNVIHVLIKEAKHSNFYPVRRVGNEMWGYQGAHCMVYVKGAK